jgi:hypothetical protein
MCCVVLCPGCVVLCCVVNFTHLSRLMYSTVGWKIQANFVLIGSKHEENRFLGTSRSGVHEERISLNILNV